MTTSKVMKNKEIPNVPDFNSGDLYIDRHDDNTFYIVMVSKTFIQSYDDKYFCGFVVLSSNNNLYQIGDYSHSWNKADFAKFTGTLVLKGE